MLERGWGGGTGASPFDVQYDDGSWLGNLRRPLLADPSFASSSSWLFLLCANMMFLPSGDVSAHNCRVSAAAPTRSFNVRFLKDSPYPKGVLSSKASGEPPLILSTSVFMAVKHAVAASRQSFGVTGHFDLPAPATVDVIQTACAVPAELPDFKVAGEE